MYDSPIKEAAQEYMIGIHRYHITPNIIPIILTNR